jgi:O-antigen ligase
LAAVVTIIIAYAAYGMVHYAMIAATRSPVSATFINRNSFATYVGIGLVAISGLILRHYRSQIGEAGSSFKYRLAAMIEASGHQGAMLIGGAIVMLVALILTASRGGLIAMGLGLLILAVLATGSKTNHSAGPRMAIVAGALLVATVVLAFGDTFLGKIAERGVTDQARMAVYTITLRSTVDAPLLGYGYGTFPDIFPVFRDQSISPDGVWDQAHNTYLEVIQGLGLVFGAMFVACVILFVVRCFKGAINRQESVTVPTVAASAAVLVGIHTLVDFSLQIQAVTLTFMALLGAGVAQSESSRVGLGD